MFDLRSLQRLVPPPGRWYHPDLARFAPDGRVIAFGGQSSVGPFDTRTDKPLEIAQDDDAQGHRTDAYFPGLGFVNIKDGVCGVVVTLIRTTSLDLPPDLLELWAQVAVRGELGPTGEFVPWDEPTWERKRIELAARPAPWPDYPFPGHVARDPLHWLRREWFEADWESRPEIATELLRRAQALGDHAEATRWRLELDRYGPFVAPPPRPANRP
ncbi:MAG: hypothetical protein K2X82_18515 [Gemmataceae bacterium]|nr:hypothetical protein [Gemmataceae bacterium]